MKRSSTIVRTLRSRAWTRNALLTAMLSTVTVACQGKGGDEGPSGALGDVAPRYTGKTLDGEYVALEDYRGQVVLLNVWATWCAPCRAELPELQALHAKYGPEGFTVVGVSTDKPQALNQLRGMVNQFGLQYPIVFDPGGEVVLTFDVSGYPTSLLLDRTGTIRWRRNGLIRPNDEELAAALRAALAQPVP